MSLVVVKVSTLAEFQAEITPSSLTRPVRLSAHEGVIARGELLELALDLQGFNHHGELLWLRQRCQIQVNPAVPHEPWTEHGQAVYVAWDHLREIVRDYLTAQGYTVLGGSYGIPADIAPLGGNFECAVWNAATQQFEAVALPTPAATTTPVSADCQEFLTWLASQLGPAEMKALQTLSPQPPTPAQAAFAEALRADTPHRRFLAALAVPHTQWTEAEWEAVRVEFAAQWPAPERPFTAPLRVYVSDDGLVFRFHAADDDTWNWEINWETGRFWLY